MADFVAVLKKTLDGLGETSPETRARVYDKARATVATKLAGINPPPPAAVAERQKKALEDAIAAVEAEYAPAKPSFEDPLEELENVFAALKEGKPIPAAKPQAPAAKPQAPAVAATPLPPQAASLPQPLPARPEPAAKTPEPPQAFDDEFPTDDEMPFRSAERAYETYEPRPRRRYGTAIAAALALLVLAGGGYAAWLNRAEVEQLLGLDSASPTAPAEVAQQPAAEAPAPDQPAAAEPATDVASAPAAETPAEAEPAPEAATKFTQRLNADGTEVDAGPASGETTVGEGTSVAALTTPVAADQPPPAAAAPATDPAAAPDAQVPPADAAAPPPTADTTATAAAPADAAAAPAPDAASSPQADQQVAVGQRAIFYEERTAVAQGSAEPGSIVWSQVQESPGGDAPPEPAIRAEATIPGKDIQLRMTIRRNADKTLPASHIIEMIFLTPEGFEGGGIDNVLRMAMKSSEQDAGSPLLGIPAKIADGFFLIALNDTAKDIETNLGLLQRQSWIDIPLVYKNGRRALFTMEKGIPGEKVFTDILKSWQPKTAG